MTADHNLPLSFYIVWTSRIQIYVEQGLVDVSIVLPGRDDKENNDNHY